MKTLSGKYGRIALASGAIMWMLAISGCENAFERNGYVVDKATRLPLEGVSVDIYLKAQAKDSLKEKVLTDQNGYFHITEKRSKHTTFLLEKTGYTGYVSSLADKQDTVFLEKNQ